MKKHIYFSSYDDRDNPYYGGGGAIAVHETAKRLSEAFTVTVITGNYKQARRGVIDGVSYERIGISWGGPKLGQLAYSLCLPFILRKKPFDLWIESFTPPFSTGLLPLFTRKPVIGLIHMLSGTDMKRKYHLPFDRLEGLGLTVYKHLITPSSAIYSIVKKANPKADIQIIPLGIDTKQFTEAKPGDYLLYLGRIEVNQKGLDLLLKAFKDLPHKYPYRLIIAGKGEEKQEQILKSIIHDFDLSDRVELVGQVDGSRKNDLISHARALLVTSRFETFSLTSLESLAAGVPLVTFTIPGLSWIPENVRLSVPAFSVTALTEAMNKVANSPEAMVKQRERGKLFAKQMDWSEVATSYAEYIRTII